MTGMARLMGMAPVIPVLVIDDARSAPPLAEALVEGGLPVLEVTLRTPVALDAIRAMRAVPGAIVGAGTVLNSEDLTRAEAAGAQFIVSPGLTAPLAHAAGASGLPFLPGIATASDLMRGLDLGLSHFKFFPAQAAGGCAALKALSAPFAMARFCPTGGITLASAPQWLDLDSVPCVGGSWLVPPGPMDFSKVRRAARAAASLRPV